MKKIRGISHCDLGLRNGSLAMTPTAQTKITTKIDKLEYLKKFKLLYFNGHQQSGKMS